MIAMDIRKWSGITILLIHALLTASSLSAGSPPPPVSEKTSQRPVQSRKVEVRGRLYQLKWEDEHLYLWSTDLEGNELHAQRITTVDNNTDQVSDCALSPWLSSRGLVAVIRVRRSDKFHFICAVSARRYSVKLQTPQGEQERKIIHLDSGMSGPIYETTEDWRVLSLDGHQSGDSFFAVIGKHNDFPDSADITKEDFKWNNRVTGVVIFNGCPVPPMNIGATPIGQK